MSQETIKLIILAVTGIALFIGYFGWNNIRLSIWSANKYVRDHIAVEKMTGVYSDTYIAKLIHLRIWFREFFRYL